MIVDSEDARELLLQTIRSGSYSGTSVEAIAALQKQVREAEVDEDADCPVKEAIDRVREE